MEPLLTELLKYGIGGLVAAIFFKLYLDERKAHDVTRGKLIDSLGAQIASTERTVNKITDPLSTMAYALDKMSDKIETNKGQH